MNDELYNEWVKEVVKPSVLEGLPSMSYPDWLEQQVYELRGSLTDRLRELEAKIGTLERRTINALERRTIH